MLNLKEIEARCEPPRHEHDHSEWFDDCAFCHIEKRRYDKQSDVRALLKEVERLRGLVKSAHREGYAAIEGFASYDEDDYLWIRSEACKALEDE